MDELTLTPEEMFLLRECFSALGWSNSEENGIYTTATIKRLGEIRDSMQKRLGIEFATWN